MATRVLGNLALILIPATKIGTAGEAVELGSKAGGAAELAGDLPKIEKGTEALKDIPEIEKEGEAIGGAEKAAGVAEAIEFWKKSKCSVDELYNYLKNIDSDAAETFLKDGTWPSKIQIPKDPSALRPDGTINWDKAPEGGYVLNSAGKADKTPFVPLKGEIIDRYGSSSGRYTSR